MNAALKFFGKIFRQVLIAAFFTSAAVWAPVVWADEGQSKNFPDDVKHVMDDGASGKFALSGKCPDSIKDAKNQVTTEDLEKYVSDNHKAIMDKDGQGYPQQAFEHLQSLLDAAAAIQCQIEGQAGHGIGKTVTERWEKVFSGAKEAKEKVFADAVLDAGYVLLKFGSQTKSLPLFKAATKLDPDNETGFLYAGDALWDLRKLSEAKAEYKKYTDMRRTKYGPHAPVLARIQERTGVKPVKVYKLTEPNPARSGGQATDSQ